jgi:acetoin:2,6-dichlorophenolindophenol oxidoreductase subunit beta
MPKKPAEVSFVDAIRDGVAEEMRDDPSVVVYGLGVNDPGRVFGTTAGLMEEFGHTRVFETPTAENAMTGVAVGAAIGGLKPIVTHQRFDFFLLAMDQLVNSAAKWRYMFGGQFSVPVVFRLITGRGWGQGPTHSQSYHSWFAQVPGLKVVMPSNASDAKSLIQASIRDPNPVVFIENRWLHHLTATLREEPISLDKGHSRIVKSGSTITIATFGYGVVEAIRASLELEAVGVHCEIIDLMTLVPFDLETIGSSLLKTGKILIVDLAPETGSFANSLLTALHQELADSSGAQMAVLAGHNLPEPTSHAAIAGFHVDAVTIFRRVGEMLGLDLATPARLPRVPADLPPSGNFGSF